ncbi:MAG TPA: tryptophan synthase subunit alpha, partial [Armatimonadetes bacterium]|nr:tryptophan synthase subunit alpha [Armatimonadota bacterium]
MTGVERLKQAFDRAKREGRAALIVYLTGCDPDFCSSLK